LSGFFEREKSPGKNPLKSLNLPSKLAENRPTKFSKNSKSGSRERARTVVRVYALSARGC